MRDLLPMAHAESCQVVATFIDIRDFSTFALTAESFDSACYLRAVYTVILRVYFPDADFCKLTGDGLMLIHHLPQSRAAVLHKVTSVLSRALRLVDEFAVITAHDIAINFPVPTSVGVGVARGSATRLVSGHFVLDYNGRCLNLAARLMDKARPRGVVFADKHAHRLIAPRLAAYFTADEVCLRSIAAEYPIPVHITDDVLIAARDREPISDLAVTRERLPVARRGSVPGSAPRPPGRHRVPRSPYLASERP